MNENFNHLDESVNYLDESINHLDENVNHFYGELNDPEVEDVELEQTDQKIDILKNLEFENFEEMPQNFKTAIETKQDQRVYRNENGVCIVSFAKKVVNESQKLSDLNLDGNFIIYNSKDNVENLSESEMKDPLLM